jgi:uncharacterized protein YgiM (DUF1202 family)
MSHEPVARTWIGYDWFKLCIGLFLVVLMFWTGPDQRATSATAPTAIVVPTSVPTPTAIIAPTSVPTPTAIIAPTSVPTATATPPMPGMPAYCTNLAPGCTAWVTRAGGLALRMRTGAGIDQSISTRLPVGTQVTLLEGPSVVGTSLWWHVRTQSEREGWVDGANLVLQPD